MSKQKFYRFNQAGEANGRRFSRGLVVASSELGDEAKDLVRDGVIAEYFEEGEGAPQTKRTYTWQEFEKEVQKRVDALPSVEDVEKELKESQDAKSALQSQVDGLLKVIDDLGGTKEGETVCGAAIRIIEQQNTQVNRLYDGLGAFGAIKKDEAPVDAALRMLGAMEKALKEKATKPQPAGSKK